MVLRSDADFVGGGGGALFLHPDAVEAAAVVAAADADLLVAFLFIESFGGLVVGFDHEDDVADGEELLEVLKDPGAEAAILGGGVDADVDDAGLAAVAVADGAADDAVAVAGDDEADVGEGPEEKQGGEAVGEAGFEGAFLEPGDLTEVGETDRLADDALRPDRGEGGGRRRDRGEDLKLVRHCVSTSGAESICLATWYMGQGNGKYGSGGGNSFAPGRRATHASPLHPDPGARRRAGRYEEPHMSEGPLNLIEAAGDGDVWRLRALLEGGDVDIDARDERGRTALMAATYANRVEAVRVLLEAGAGVDIQDAMLNDPFLYAGAEGLLEILQLAHEAGADPTITNRYGGVAVIPAAEKGHLENVRYLLEETAVDVNHVNNLGWTALLEAIILTDGGPTHQEIVRVLIEHGADVNLADGEGVSPLQHARKRGFGEIARMLEEAGATA
jgi:uncharacterized protein